MTETEARQWILDILDVAGRGAKLSPNVIDDNVVAASVLAVKNDQVWGWMWRWLEPLLGRGELVVGTPSVDDVQLVADEAKIDPFTIIAIIDAVMKLIELFRRR